MLGQSGVPEPPRLESKELGEWVSLRSADRTLSHLVLGVAREQLLELAGQELMPRAVAERLQGLTGEGLGMMEGPVVPGLLAGVANRSLT